MLFIYLIVITKQLSFARIYKYMYILEWTILKKLQFFSSLATFGFNSFNIMGLSRILLELLCSAPIYSHPRILALFFCRVFCPFLISSTQVVLSFCNLFKIYCYIEYFSPFYYVIPTFYASLCCFLKNN